MGRFWAWLALVVLLLAGGAVLLWYFLIEPRLAVKILWRVAPPAAGTLEVAQENRKYAAADQLLAGETVTLLYHGRWKVDQLQWQYSVDQKQNEADLAWLEATVLPTQGGVTWQVPALWTKTLRFRVVSRENPTNPPATLNTAYYVEPSWSVQGPGDQSGQELLATAPAFFTVKLPTPWPWGEVKLALSTDQKAWAVASPVVYWPNDKGSSDSQYQWTPPVSWQGRSVYLRWQTDKDQPFRSVRNLKYPVVILPAVAAWVPTELTGSITNLSIVDTTMGTQRYIPGTTVTLQWTTTPVDLKVTHPLVSWSEFADFGFDKFDNGLPKPPLEASVGDHSAVVQLPLWNKLTRGNVIYLRIAGTEGSATSAALTLQQRWSFWTTPESRRIWTYSRSTNVSDPPYQFEMPLRIEGVLPASWMDTSNWQLDLIMEDQTTVLVDVAKADLSPGHTQSYGSLSLNYVSTTNLYFMVFSGWVGREFGRMAADWLNVARQDLVSFTPVLKNKLVDTASQTYPSRMTLVRASGGTTGASATVSRLDSIAFTPGPIAYCGDVYACTVTGGNLGWLVLYLVLPTGAELPLANGWQAYFNGNYGTSVSCTFILPTELRAGDCALRVKLVYGAKTVSSMALTPNTFGVQPRLFLEAPTPGVTSTTVSPWYIGQNFGFALYGWQGVDWTYDIQASKDGVTWISTPPPSGAQSRQVLIDSGYQFWAIFGDEYWSLTDVWRFRIKVTGNNVTIYSTEGIRRSFATYYVTDANAALVPGPSFQWRLALGQTLSTSAGRRLVGGQHRWVYSFEEWFYVYPKDAAWSPPVGSTNWTVWLWCESSNAATVPHRTWFQVTQDQQGAGFRTQGFDVASRKVALRMPNLEIPVSNCYLMLRCLLSTGRPQSYLSEAFEVGLGFSVGLRTNTSNEPLWSLGLQILEGALNTQFSDAQTLDRRGLVVRFCKPSATVCPNTQYSWVSGMVDSGIVEPGKVKYFTDYDGRTTPGWQVTTWTCTAGEVPVGTSRAYTGGGFRTPLITIEPNTFEILNLGFVFELSNELSLVANTVGGTRSADLVACYPQWNATPIQIEVMTALGRSERLVVTGEMAKTFTVSAPAPYWGRVRPETALTAGRDAFQPVVAQYEARDTFEATPLRLPAAGVVDQLIEFVDASTARATWTDSDWVQDGAPPDWVPTSLKVLSRTVLTMADANVPLVYIAMVPALLNSPTPNDWGVDDDTIIVPVNVFKPTATARDRALGLNVDTVYQVYRLVGSAWVYQSTEVGRPLYTFLPEPFVGGPTVPRALVTGTTFGLQPCSFTFYLGYPGWSPHIGPLYMGLSSYQPNTLLSSTLPVNVPLGLAYTRRLEFRPYAFRISGLLFYYFRVVIDGADSQYALGPDLRLVSPTQPLVWFHNWKPAAGPQRLVLSSLEISCNLAFSFRCIRGIPGYEYALVSDSLAANTALPFALGVRHGVLATATPQWRILPKVACGLQPWACYGVFRWVNTYMMLGTEDNGRAEPETGCCMASMWWFMDDGRIQLLNNNWVPQNMFLVAASNTLNAAVTLVTGGSQKWNWDAKGRSAIQPVQGGSVLPLALSWAGHVDLITASLVLSGDVAWNKMEVSM